MHKRSSVFGGCKLFSAMRCRVAALLLSVLPLIQPAYAQAGKNPPAHAIVAQAEPQKVPLEATPIIVEHRKTIAGATFDTRFRFEMSLGEPRDKCAVWRIESWARPDGRVVFQLNDPADKKVLLDSQYDPRFVEFIVGDAECNYRIRIERNK